jgi:hypothetical protein
MSEDNIKRMLGRVKLVLAHHPDEDKWNILTIRVWSDAFDTNFEKAGLEGYTSDALFEMSEEFKEVLKDKFKLDKLQVFEIVGELHEESWKSWTDCGYEYDTNNWLENEKVREVVGSDLKYFKEECSGEWEEFYGKEGI